jgi:polyisoprenyl-phosphate glycosyltransferase
MTKQPILYIIVPCYNEEAVLPQTSGLFLDELNDLSNKGKISKDSRVLFVDDGSRDGTWAIISDLAARDEHYLGIRQSRNRGHQNAVLAGLMEAKDVCDISISIDCDGQDDIHAMEAMVDAYHDGCEIVYGVRTSRATDTVFKRLSAESFYKLLNFMGVDVVYNHADYRLMSRRALEELAKFREVNLYLRGMVPLIGFKSTSVGYERHERLAGKSHYPLRKMLSLAFDGISSMSIKPMRMIAGAGVFFFVLSLIGIVWSIITELCGHAVPGWASTACIVLLMGGIQSLFMGVIGEYVGKIYLEVKDRPRYIISERTAPKKDD